MATINDVSIRAAVSRSTVSRYITKSGYVSENARKSIQEAIDETGFRPNRNAQALRLSRSNILGGVVADLSSPYYAQLVAGMQMACKSAGKGLLLTSGLGNPSEEENAILGLLDRSCDGLLLNLEFPLSKTAREALVGANVPFVMIASVSDTAAAGSVSIENRLGACAMTTHLLQLGHRRILHVAGNAYQADTSKRIEGTMLALKEAGLPQNTVTLDTGSYTEQHGFETVKRHFSSGRPFTAIQCGDDDIAAGALLALREFGLRVPQDVSLTGFDDNFHARHLSPPLTTVRQPIGEAGTQAVELLLDALSSPVPNLTEIMLPTEIILRGSTAVTTN
jgi:LacI family transcriptional regulator